MRVYQDSHGLYVRTGGYLFRPLPSISPSGRIDRGPEGGYGHAPVRLLPDVSRYHAGELVKGRHIATTTWAIVGDELWVSHGAYAHYDYSVGKWLRFDSEQCYNFRQLPAPPS